MALNKKKSLLFICSSILIMGLIFTFYNNNKIIDVHAAVDVVDYYEDVEDLKELKV